MKLFSARFAPSPRRVEIYLREKGLDIEVVRLDFRAGEQRAPEFLTKNPLGQVPVLELDDGGYLSESEAIIEYLEELHPEPPLIGTTPLERARTREAQRIAEMGVYLGAALAFQHAHPFFASRHQQRPEIAEHGRKVFGRFCRRLDQLLVGRTWLAGERFTTADITAICAIDFGAPVDCQPREELSELHRWLSAVRERPSCALARG